MAAYPSQCQPASTSRNSGNYSHTSATSSKQSKKKWARMRVLASGLRLYRQEPEAQGGRNPNEKLVDKSSKEVQVKSINEGTEENGNASFCMETGPAIRKRLVCIRVLGKFVLYVGSAGPGATQRRHLRQQGRTKRQFRSRHRSGG